jgi:hypothetical protein
MIGDGATAYLSPTSGKGAILFSGAAVPGGNDALSSSTGELSFEAEADGDDVWFVQPGDSMLPSEADDASPGLRAIRTADNGLAVSTPSAVLMPCGW